MTGDPWLEGSSKAATRHVKCRQCVPPQRQGQRQGDPIGRHDPGKPTHQVVTKSRRTTDVLTMCIGNDESAQDEEKIDPNAPELEDTNRCLRVIGLCQDKSDVAQDNADRSNAAPRFNAGKPATRGSGHPLSKPRLRGITGTRQGGGTGKFRRAPKYPCHSSPCGRIPAGRHSRARSGG